MNIVDNIIGTVGNTPLVRLDRLFGKTGCNVVAKLEAFNPCGSVKDRIGMNMIEEAEKNGKLKPGGIVIEATSGNTGIGLAFVCAVKGYKLILAMPDTMSNERLCLLKAFGAKVELTPGAGGMSGAIKKAEKIFKTTPGAFMPRQFINPANPDIHK
ncbi:cysteine synthase family protein, partial [bacterium]|nr:cysteine synthase family protein [bacterium]